MLGVYEYMFFCVQTIYICAWYNKIYIYLNIYQYIYINHKMSFSYISILKRLLVLVMEKLFEKSTQPVRLQLFKLGLEVWTLPHNTTLCLKTPSSDSKISPTYPWKIPKGRWNQQFMKEFLSLWGFGEVWGIFPGYVGKIIEWCVGQTPSDVWDLYRYIPYW